MAADSDRRDMPNDLTRYVEAILAQPNGKQALTAIFLEAVRSWRENCRSIRNSLRPNRGRGSGN